MFKPVLLKNIVTTCALLFVVIPAVDGGVTEFNFEGSDKAPLNKHVKQFVKKYIHQNRKNLYIIKQRSNSPFIMIDSVFRTYGLPVQLKYLAVVESELKAKAVSRVGAAGPWQLMPSTARILGLKVNSRHDERKNYYKSPRAAARYLKDLHVKFGDWFLVFAAYNSGEVTVDAAIRQSGTRNFWMLQRYLPEETREYVKKFIATCYYIEGIYSPSLMAKKVIKSKTNSSNRYTYYQSVKYTLKDMPEKKNETSEEKFNRILSESEKTQKKSGSVLKNHAH